MRINVFYGVVWNVNAVCCLWKSLLVSIFWYWLLTARLSSFLLSCLWRLAFVDMYIVGLRGGYVRLCIRAQMLREVPARLWHLKINIHAHVLLSSLFIQTHHFYPHWFYMYKKYDQSHFNGHFSVWDRTVAFWTEKVTKHSTKRSTLSIRGGFYSNQASKMLMPS